MRESLDFCLGCGYDLAGIRDTRCPECGLEHSERLRELARRVQRVACRPFRAALWTHVALLLAVLVWPASVGWAATQPVRGTSNYLQWLAWPLGSLVLAHGVGFFAVRGRAAISRQRGALWLQIAPILHAPWLLWPYVAMGPGVFQFDLWPAAVTPLVGLALWRLAWWINAARLGLSKSGAAASHPTKRHWAASALIALGMAPIFTISVMALASVGV